MLRGVPPPTVARKVVVGKNGRLFLDYDTNQIMAQQTGVLRFEPEELDRWRTLLEERTAWLAERGACYLFLVVPDAASVFPADLPDDLRPVATRPLVQLQEHLRASGSPAELLYPLEQLQSDGRHETYPKTETHWTEWGAFLAYRMLVERLLGRVALREVTDRDIVVTERLLPGDLGVQVEPPAKSLHAYVEMRHPPAARFVSDNRIMNRGRRIEYECEAAPDVCCLVLGDSYANRFAHVLAESFRRLVIGSTPTVDRDLVEEVRPQVVIQESAERFLIRAPDDVRDPTLRRWEAMKRDQGKVWGPRATRGNRVSSSLG